MSESSGLEIIGGEVTETGLSQSHAEAEEKRLYEEQEGKHKRSQRTRHHIHLGSLIIFWVGVGLFCAFVIVWAWHLLTPVCCHFVTETNRDIIQGILVGIVGSSSLTGYARGWFNKYSE